MSEDARIPASGSHDHQQGKRVDVVTAAILAVIAVIVVLRLRYGFNADLQDEGFHLIGPLRLVLGDSPFRDEALSVLRASDVLVAPLFWLLPDGGVIFWRLVGFALQVLAALCAFWLLRRIMPRPVAVGWCASILLFAPYNLWAPWYGNLAGILVLVSTCLWIGATRAMTTRRALIGALFGGLIFSLLALNYTPMLVLAVIPLVGLVVKPSRPVREQWFPATSAWLAGAAVGTLLTVGILSVTGLLDWAIVSTAELRSVAVYSGSPLRAVARKLSQSGYLDQAGAVVVVFLALGGTAGAARRHTVRVAAQLAGTGGFVCLVLAFVVELCTNPGPLVDQRFLTLGNLALGSFAAGFASARWRQISADPWGLHAVGLLCIGIGMAGVLAVISAAGLSALNGAGWLGWAGALACLANPIVVQHESAVSRQRRGWPALVITGALVTVTAAHLMLWTYDDRPFWHLDAKFEEGKLRGVITTEARRRDYSRLIEGVQARTNPGDFILAYDDLAWVYYLSDTRPAMRSSLLKTGRLPDEVEARWLEDMHQRGRVPKIVVTRDALTGDSPFVRFISENYTVFTRTGAMVLWRPNASER
jgi:hypothetical protein